MAASRKRAGKAPKRPDATRARARIWTAAERAAFQERIVAEVSSGRSLSEVCRDPGMPGVQTVIDWCAKDEAWRARYEEAQRTSCEVWADRILEVAKTRTDHPDDVQHRRLEIDALKWLLAKKRPERFGDRTHVEHSGSMTLEQLIAESRKPAE